MTHFLQNLDQWSLQILMVIYNLLGVQDLPKQPDPHWQVIERWAPQPEGHYRLILESTTIQEECRSGRAKYIIFPQTYMAKQEVYADNIRIYTNEMDEEWHLSTVADRPVVSCDLIRTSRNIKLINHSLMSYFSSINSWHTLATRYPREHLFYNTMYILVGILSAFVSLICFLIVIFLGEKTYNVLFLGLSIYGLMLSHYPGYMITVHVGVIHQIILISIICIAYVVLFENKFYNFFKSSHLYFISYLVVNVFLALDSANTAQVLIIFNAFVALSIMLIRSINRNYDLEQRVVYFFTSVLYFRDLYSSQKYREGFLNLTLSCLILVLIMAMRSLFKIYRKNINFTRNEEKLRNETKILEKMKEVNLKIKQVLHDIKSPITSLNFLLSTQSGGYSEKIKIPLDRLNFLVGGAGMNSEILTDWYSVDILLECIKVVEQEKAYITGKIKYSRFADDRMLVFFNPDYIKVLFAELIDNSVKNNMNHFLNIEINFRFNENFEIEYSDDGVGLSDEMLGGIGKLGYSTKGWGLGLHNIIKIVGSWGGAFSIIKVKRGFKCTLSLPFRRAQ